MIKAHTGGVRCVAFSPDSTSLLSASDDKTIKMWSIAGHKFKQTLSGHSNWVRAARFSPAGPRPPHPSPGLFGRTNLVGPGSLPRQS